MRKLLLQLDSSRHPSVFDRVVAYDGGADEVMSYGGVTEDAVRDLVHGCIFTRGPKDLHNTAIFIGGTDMAAGERLLAAVTQSVLRPDARVGDARFERLEYDRRGRRGQAAAAAGDVDGTTCGGHRRHRPGRRARRRPAGQGSVPT